MMAADSALVTAAVAAAAEAGRLPPRRSQRLRSRTCWHWPGLKIPRWPRAQPICARLPAGPASSRNGGAPEPPDGSIVVADDLGPGDVAAWAKKVIGIVLGRERKHGPRSDRGPLAGDPAGHRGRGRPCWRSPPVRRSPWMPTAAWSSAGSTPAPAGGLQVRIERAEAEVERGRSERLEPAVTTDGRAVRLLANAGTLVEVEAALAAGAEGIGLLRTELAFLDALDWPDRSRSRGGTGAAAGAAHPPGGDGAHARFRRRQDAAVPDRVRCSEHARSRAGSGWGWRNVDDALAPQMRALLAGFGRHDSADSGADGDRRGRDRRRSRGRARRSRCGRPGSLRIRWWAR